MISFEVFERDGELWTDSLSVAEVFRKGHDDLLRVIRKIDKENHVVNLRSFAAIKYVDSRGREQDAFEMTETGFFALVARFNERDGKQWTTSLNVADVFGKDHGKIIRDIENLECSQQFNRANFGLIDYVDSRGRTQPMYEMTRDGFSFLVMGFTGAKAPWSNCFPGNTTISCVLKITTTTYSDFVVDFFKNTVKISVHRSTTCR